VSPFNSSGFVSDASAGSAVPLDAGTAPPHVRVLWRELVAALTPIDSNADGTRCFATEHVDPLRHGFEVVRIHAATVAAEVVDVEAIWDRAFEEFMRDAVGDRGSPLAIGGEDRKEGVAGGLEVGAGPRLAEPYGSPCRSLRM
jgi:hypothetical protein